MFGSSSPAIACFTCHTCHGAGERPLKTPERPWLNPEPWTYAKDIYLTLNPEAYRPEREKNWLLPVRPHMHPHRGCAWAGLRQRLWARWGVVLWTYIEYQECLLSQKVLFGIVLQKTIPAQIRQLILYISNDEKWLCKHFLWDKIGEPDKVRIAWSRHAPCFHDKTPPSNFIAPGILFHKKY